MKLQAFSEVSHEERVQLEQQEIKGMKHLLSLALRPDFHRDMLRDRRLTHPDLVQPCGALSLQQVHTAVAAQQKLHRSLSRKLSSGGGSMQQLLKQASISARQNRLNSTSTVDQDLIAVAYPDAIASSQNICNVHCEQC